MDLFSCKTNTANSRQLKQRAIVTEKQGTLNCLNREELQELGSEFKYAVNTLILQKRQQQESEHKVTHACMHNTPNPRPLPEKNKGVLIHKMKNGISLNNLLKIQG